MILYVTNDCDPNSLIMFLNENRDNVELVRFDKNEYAGFIANKAGVRAVRTVSGSAGCTLALGRDGETINTD